MDFVQFNLTSWSNGATPRSGQPGDAWRSGAMANRQGMRRAYAPLGLLGASAGSHGNGSEGDPSPDAAWGDGDVEDEDPVRRRMRAEAVLLLSKGPLSTRKLAQLARLADGTEARTMIRRLNELYEEHGRAMRIEKVAGGHRLVTRPALAPWLRRLSHVPSPVRLSTPMMETLAVVAYRQPVSRADTEAVRGVACGELLRQLMERDLIRMTGRSEELGRPYLYGTTKHFLQLFGLTGTDALPKIDWQTIRDDPEAKSPDDVTSENPSLESPQESSTSTKESVVTTALAPAAVLSEPVSSDAEAVAFPANVLAIQNAPVDVIEDEEDDLFEGGFESDDDEEEIDDDDFSDDWDDDEEEDDDEEDDLDGDDDEEDDDEESDEDSGWEEVGDDDDDDDDEDWDDDDDEEEEDWDDEDESADDDEDWTE